MNALTNEELEGLADDLNAYIEQYTGQNPKEKWRPAQQRNPLKDPLIRRLRYNSLPCVTPEEAEVFLTVHRESGIWTGYFEGLGRRYENSDVRNAIIDFFQKK